ncbi:MAG: type II secretion system protein [Capsulimonadaceae bacterium]
MRIRALERPRLDALFRRRLRPQSQAALFAFTLIELLVVIAIIAVLCAIMFPVFATAQEHGRQAVCESNLHQLGLGMQLYEGDYDEVLPSRIDLKTSLPGGWMPWNPHLPTISAWPTSDPRCGWAAIVLFPYLKNYDVFSCPSVAGKMKGVQQVQQPLTSTQQAPVTRYWMWRFDRPTLSCASNPDEWWGLNDFQAVIAQQRGYALAMQTHTSYPSGDPTGTADAEMATDPYFPSTVGTVPSKLKGVSVHIGGRNRLYLDGHAKWVRDVRLTP